MNKGEKEKRNKEEMIKHTLLVVHIKKDSYEAKTNKPSKALTSRNCLA